VLRGQGCGFRPLRGNCHGIWQEQASFVHLVGGGDGMEARVNACTSALEGEPQTVIPAKRREMGREPGSRKPAWIHCPAWSDGRGTIPLARAGADHWKALEFRGPPLVGIASSRQGMVCHLPSNFAGRFSRNAAIPSMKSRVSHRVRWQNRSYSSCSSRL